MRADEGLDQIVDRSVTVAEAASRWPDKDLPVDRRADGSLQLDLGIGKQQNWGILGADFGESPTQSERASSASG